MKIGIDAKWYFRGPPSGRRVVRNLVRHLLAQAGDDEIHVFTDRDARQRPLEVPIPPDRRHGVWAGNNQLSNLAVVPRVADRLGLDAVVYQSFVPLRSRGHARIAFVYDAIFETRPEFFTALERIYFTPMRYLARSADRVCTGSHAERHRLIALGYATPDRIHVVPNAVDDAFVAGASGRGDVPGLPPRYVLFVGRMNARKNLATLVRAMALLDDPVALVVAGPREAGAAGLSTVMRETRMEQRVIVMGPVSDASLRELYASATVFCFPSFDEGFGLPPLEAMALGTPCVVSDIPVLRELCGDAALYADPRDPASIAAAIGSLLRSPDAARRDAGFARAAQFRWEASATALLDCVRATERLSA